MSNLIKSEIETITAAFSFSDGSKVAKRLSEIIIKNNSIGFSIDITDISLDEAKMTRELLIKALEAKLSNHKISIILTSTGSNQKPKKHPQSKIILEDIKKIILVASGKGGVGKSTIAALIAQKLASQQKKVGLLDADIYGPSIPDIFGINKQPELVNKRMVPLEKYNVKLNSIGFITDPTASISWRGPMTSKALYQLISLTAWENLDYLIIDTPPGTGDIHLSLLQNYEVSSVIMITTPQKISSIDVQRAINLYQRFNIPILGIIENMSSLFPGNSGKTISESNNIPLLAQIPLTTGLSEACDKSLILKNYFNLIDFVV